MERSRVVSVVRDEVKEKNVMSTVSRFSSISSGINVKKRVSNDNTRQTTGSRLLF